MKKIYLLFIIILAPIVDYNFLACMPILLLFFIERYNRLALFNFFLFLIFGLLIYFNNTNITSFKYLLSMIVLLFLLSNKKNITIKLFNLTTIILLIYAVIESMGYRDILRSFYRSSNQELHYDRYSCFFLFPGDLGAYAAIAVSLHLLLLIINSNYSKKRINYIFIFLNFILILLSQSRMALLHIFISFIIIVIFRPRYFLFLLIFLPVFILFQENMSYLFREDLISLATSFFSSDASTGNKRAEEIFEILNSTESESGYYEGSFPSLVFRFGNFLSTVILCSIFVSFYKFWEKNNSKMASLIVIFPILFTSLISAPLERPKLLIFSFGAILLAVTLTSNVGTSRNLAAYENI